MGMLAYARIELGLSEAEFWRASPGRFVAYQRMRASQIRRRNFRAGIITCVIRQALGDKNADPMDPWKPGQEQVTVMPDEEAMAIWLAHKAEKDE